MGPAPVETGTLDDLPLFATNAPGSAPASVPTNGEIVTLEELARMVRRRKAKPKAAPEGQLALFAS